MEKYIMYVIVLPVLWFVMTITYEFSKLIMLWLNLKINDIKRKFK